ncbi:MAG: tRNA(His) guanylyltransferase Thg1 family protein [Methanobrevibacter sp.]|nr:tRNA(His) guanylyltransferase Thg1 family protein [Methanobrevibacter sp.]
MHFNEFDSIMRVYEESLDQYILPDMYIAVRLDGRSFTGLTKRMNYEKPFDVKFRDLMVDTVKALMDAGFRVVYGYTQSDEISLLFHQDEDTFGRKVRKINTTLSGEASAAFSLGLGEIATFDSRVIPLPNERKLADYFAWRQEDSKRNALQGYCYWTLRHEGKTASQASRILNKQGYKFKIDLLEDRGINFDEIPYWQRFGVGVYFKDVEREGFNPIKNEKVIAKRRELIADNNLPTGDEYREFILEFINK